MGGRRLDKHTSRMSQSIILDGRRKKEAAQPACSSVEDKELILDGALGGVKGCSHLGDRTPAERKRDVLLELAHENVRR